MWRRGFSEDKITETLNECDKIVNPIEAQITKHKKVRLWTLIILFSLSLIIGISVSASTGQWIYLLLGTLIYIVVGGMTASFMKERCNGWYRELHFLLAVHLRAANNKVYLKMGVELRPGYIGRWIEIKSIKERTRAKYLYSVEERVKAQNLEPENIDAIQDAQIDQIIGQEIQPPRVSSYRQPIVDERTPD